VPLTRPLVILPIETEHPFITSITHPESPDISGHEFVHKGHNGPFEIGVGNLGFKRTAIEYEVTHTSVEMSIGAIVQQPRGQSIFHCDYFGSDFESSFSWGCSISLSTDAYVGTSVPTKILVSEINIVCMFSMSRVNSV
jgi:hypothetical protein